MEFPQKYRKKLSQLAQKLEGRDERLYMEQLVDMEYWDRNQILNWQEKELISLMSHALKNVPYYKEKWMQSGIEPIWQGWHAWYQLPILTKDNLRNFYHELISQNNSDRLKKSKTSGSTGTPISVLKEPSARAWSRAHVQLAHNRFGVDLNDPSVWLIGVPRNFQSKLKFYFSDLIQNKMRTPCFDLSEKSLCQIWNKIRKFKPKVLNGYTSALYRLCQFCLDSNKELRDVGISLNVTQSEVLYDYQRKVIEEATATLVMNVYGCVEVEAMAYECPYGTFHINHTHVLLEIVDDNGLPTQPGQIGRVLLTPLRARAMPLIRYEVGDLAVIKNEACPCGIQPGMPLLDRIEGRQWDRMFSTDGHPFHTVLLYYAAKEAFSDNAIIEYQGVQQKLNKIVVKIIKGKLFRQEELDTFSKILKGKLGNDMLIEFEFVNHIKRTQAGKLRFFICEIPEQNG